MNREYNYHTHTRWCGHATGNIEDYIIEAIKHNYKEIAITDHMPYHYKKGFKRAMDLEKFDLFDKELDEMIQKYQSRIHVRKGMECEYYPDNKEFYPMLRERGYEILLLSQHNDWDQTINYFYNVNDEAIRLYQTQLCEAIETGWFDIVAHPDLIMNSMNQYTPFAIEAMRKIFESCEKHNVIVEYNCIPVRQPVRRYSREETYEISKQYNLKYVIGADAHKPSELHDYSIAIAQKKLQQLNLKEIEIGEL